jgi:hypothetical protein
MIKFRGHTLVIGATGTGKGVFCDMMAAAWRKQPGMKVFALVNKQEEYDKLSADFKTMDQFRFLEEIQRLTAPAEGYANTLAVIDEAWAWDWKKKKDGLQFVPNAARAKGVEMIVQSQFPTQMAPTVRANCDNLVCFGVKPDAAEWAAKQYHKRFLEAVNLPDGHFIMQRGRGEPVAGIAWQIKNGKFTRADGKT